MADALSPSHPESRLRHAFVPVLLDEMDLDPIIFNLTQERDIIVQGPKIFSIKSSLLHCYVAQGFGLKQYGPRKIAKA